MGRSSTSSSTPNAISRSRKSSKEPATGLDLETTFSDYNSVGGLLMPHQLASALGGTPADTTTIESIELNVPVDEAEFKKPEPGAVTGDGDAFVLPYGRDPIEGVELGVAANYVQANEDLTGERGGSPCPADPLPASSCDALRGCGLIRPRAVANEFELGNGLIAISTGI